MRICFVYPDIGGVEHYGTRKYYHGIGYISSMLKGAGHETTLVYVQSELDRAHFLAGLEAARPDVVAFSSTTHQHPFIEQWTAWIKEAHPDWVTVSGGTHPTLVPEEVIAWPHLDFLCVGEGEYPMQELADRLEHGGDPTTIPNLWARRDEEIVRNPLRPLIADLDLLPFADRELFDFDEILRTNGGWVDMMAGRGCPYQCSYCCNPGLQQRFKGLGKYVRFRSVPNILAEIRSLTRRYPVRVLNFQDDVFTLDREWVLEFCYAYVQEFTIPFWINTRVERISDEELVAALASAGCRGVRIGIESGNEQLRAEILKRRMTNDQIRAAFRLLRKYGLETYTCNMIGIPGETPEMMAETVALNRELEPTDLQFSVFYPYPMTELYRLSLDRGYLEEGAHLVSYYGRESILRLPTMTKEDLARGYEEFGRLKADLRLRRSGGLKQWAYRLLRVLCGSNDARARAVLQALGRTRGRMSRLVQAVRAALLGG